MATMLATAHAEASEGIIVAPVRVKPRVLCVDDDPALLEGLELSLGRRFQVNIATSGGDALQMMLHAAPYAVVLSDMRMPIMDGARFLARVRATAPDTVRMLLTGQADVPAAIAAINEGQVFRFLTKPCAPANLVDAVDAAVAQHRLIHAERELLELTLRGAVKALAELLGIADPLAYGRACRIQRLCLDLAGHLKLAPVWPLELAALLSQVGSVSLPPQVMRKLHGGDALNVEEREMVARLPEVTERLLGNIPRLEPVREVLRRSRRAQPLEDYAETTDVVALNLFDAARILRLATAYELLEARGLDAAVVVQELRSTMAPGDAPVLDALAVVRAEGHDKVELRQLPLAKLVVGMVFAEDVRTVSGQLLIARGFEVTAGFMERARNLRPGLVREPVRVLLRKTFPLA